MSNWQLAALVAILLIPGLVKAQDAFVADEFTKSIPVQGNAELIIRNSDGLVSLKPSASQEVKIHATKEVWRAKSPEEAKKEADRVRIEIEEFAGRIKVQVYEPGRVFSIGNHPRVKVRLEIEAPPTTKIDAGVSDGDLSIEGFQSKLALSTADGKIEARNLSGEVDLHASDGEIHAEQLSGELSFRVSDGDILGNNCSGNIKVRASDGSIRLEGVNGTMDAYAGDGDIQIKGKISSLTGRISDGKLDVSIDPESVMEEDWNLQSSDGDITITLPEKFSADLQISASDGHIRSDHPIQVSGSLSGRKWTGKLGEGGHLIQVRTSDGDIILR